MSRQTSRGRGGLLLSEQSSPRGWCGLAKHAATRHGSPSLPASNVVLAAQLLHALVLVLLHAGDALVPGTDLLGLAGLHHGVRAGGGHELGVPRPLLGRHHGRPECRAKVCRRTEGVCSPCRSSTETEGGVLLLLLLLLVSAPEERGLVPPAGTEETPSPSKSCSSGGRGCKYQC